MNELVEKILASKKYRGICADTVTRICTQCASRYKKTKDIENAVREKLHGITGAFLTQRDIDSCFNALKLWQENGRTDEALERALSCHASTRERLPLAGMDEIMRRIEKTISRPNNILDIACGINPIYLGARGYNVRGMDISGDAIQLVNAAGSMLNMQISAICADILCESTLPSERFDLALLMKVLPLLEREKAGFAKELLESLGARHILVSFPTRTLGGRQVGMANNYDAWMQANLPSSKEVIDTFSTNNELFYILAQKGDS